MKRLQKIDLVVIQLKVKLKCFGSYAESLFSVMELLGHYTQYKMLFYNIDLEYRIQMLLFGLDYTFAYKLF